MERRFNLGRIAISAVAVLLVALFLLMLFNDSKLQSFFTPDYNQNSEYDYEQEQIIERNITKVQASLDKSFSSIVLYADEYGGDGVLAKRLYDTINNKLFGSLNAQLQKYPRIIGHSLSIPVSNFEVHDESFEAILARIGVETVFTSKRFTMPASVEEQAEIHLKTIANTPIKLKKQTHTSLGNVTVGNIPGQLSLSILENTENDDEAYIFRRNENGEETKILSGAKVKFESSEKYRDSLPIIFFGKYEPSDVKKYIKSINSIIAHQNINDKYIVICRTPANSELDEAMTETFGMSYIRTDDRIDFNDLAEKIYYRMKTMKYLDIIANSVKKAEKRILPEE